MADGHALRTASWWPFVVRFAFTALAACGTRPAADAPSNVAPPDGTVVLYRDRALVMQRVEIDVPASGIGRARVAIAADIGASDIVIPERGIRELHVASGSANAADVVLSAPPGRHAVRLVYVTDRMSWDAAYTITTTPARAQATVRGTLAIHNATGVALTNVTLRIVDDELAVASRSVPDLIASEDATSSRALGPVHLVDGETRVELVPDGVVQRLRSVLVYDPVGTDLDRASAAPVRDQTLGARVTATRVTESLEIVRGALATRGLPGGPVRLLERRPDRSLALLGEARLFDATTRGAASDLVPIGTAEGVTGRRERREYSYDEPRKRLTEDFVLAIANARTRPVEVIIREHMYRGQNWTLAYRSSPVAAKEGPQQIAMRMTVPAKGHEQLLYVVVYSWP